MSVSLTAVLLSESDAVNTMMCELPPASAGTLPLMRRALALKLIQLGWRVSA